VVKEKNKDKEITETKAHKEILYFETESEKKKKVVGRRFVTVNKPAIFNLDC
jgi:hypothetical protein